MRRHATFIVAAMTALAVASPAAAARPRHHHHHRPRPRAVAVDPQAVALSKARDLWGGEPCGGHYVVQTVLLTNGVGAVAEWDGPNGRNVFGDPTAWTDCAISLNALYWEGITADSTVWPNYCTVILHEYGHLTGHAHSDTEASIEPSGMTPEQLAVMNSGEGESRPDYARCGQHP